MTNHNNDSEEHDEANEEVEEEVEDEYTEEETVEEDTEEENEDEYTQEDVYDPFQDENPVQAVGNLVTEMLDNMQEVSRELNERRQERTGQYRQAPRRVGGRVGPFAFGFQHVQMREELDEDDEVYRLYADLPGIAEGELNVTATEDDVTITASNDTRDYNVQRTLPVRVDPDNTTATYNNGVLEIVFPFADTSDSGTTINVE